MNSLIYHVYLQSGSFFPILSSKHRSEYISMKVRELLLAHFVPSILKLSNFPGSIKKPLAYEIIRDTKLLSIL
jgi:hypothetical protein